ncbi:MAG: PASTA domain-containing protein [Chitinophagaceae bacterium]|nr:PASTA domain-containing protein [Chitinophagaceae bacterium]
MFKFIKKRPFWVSLVLIIGIIFLIIVLFLQSLRFFTHHGSYLKVPDVYNKDIKDATALLNGQGFDVQVLDSVYYDTLAPRSVVKQFPEPDATVKVNRVVYLTINRAVPPIIEMPNLVGMSFRNAELEIRTRGLKLGDTSYKPDIAKNAVLDQLIKNQTVKPGTKITMGTTISLVLGAGVSSEDMPVPDLFGMNFEEAAALLEANGIVLSSVVPDGNITDTGGAFVFWQQPDRVNPDGSINRIRKGQMMDVRITAVKPVRKIADSTAKAATGANEY